jgi:hypothetical protein
MVQGEYRDARKHPVSGTFAHGMAIAILSNMTVHGARYL